MSPLAAGDSIIIIENRFVEPVSFLLEYQGEHQIDAEIKTASGFYPGFVDRADEPGRFS